MSFRSSTLLVFLALLTVTVTALSGLVRESDDSNQMPCDFPLVNCNLEDEDKIQGGDEVADLYGTFPAQILVFLHVIYRNLNDVATSSNRHGLNSTRAPPILLS